MTSRLYPSSPLLGACTAIWRNDKILLARRGKEPHCGTWAMPGGMVETGESLEQAAIREVVEETGLRLGPLIFNRYHEIIQRDEYGEVRTHVVLAMFVGKSDSGDAVAGDDAESVDWFTVEQLSRLSLTGDTAIFVHESLNHLPLL